ncbi:aldolase [Xylanibacillus composti]|uniref:HPr kinase n=1 Tax=Xylanibacillus composti TaxID=1572762 RepID=A0A8J4H3A0_9BACL|nr:aldolase [Xylanibacillus composti]MDT9726092.1 aldolase [Xylanibacillus composti]GIQ68761.1 HPr kinase [Xylanibacillus composti]
MDRVRMPMQAFGLHIVSELPMPELQAAEAGSGEAQVEVTLADLTDEWRQYGGAASYCAIYDDKLYLRVPDLALYCVEGGRSIKVSPLPDAPAARVRMYVLGTCMGVLLMQRGTLPLHGSAVLMNGQAYAFVGESGAGKSTLAAAFVREGFSIISDDVIAVDASSRQTAPIVAPAYPQQKLWQTSLEQLGMDGAERYTPLYETKYAVPTNADFHPSPVPLGGVFELDKEHVDSVSLMAVQGLKKLPLLQQHTYRHELIPLLGRLQWHLDMCVALSRTVPIFKLRRPAEGFLVEEMMRQIMDAARMPMLRASSTKAR